MIICLIIGIISILYGIAIMRVASGTLFYTVWFAIGICFILLGAALRAHLLRLLPRGLKIILILLVLLGAGTLCATCFLQMSHFHDKRNDQIDCLIVLGAQVKSSGSSASGESPGYPSAVLQYRLDTAAAYLKTHPDILCVVSGGQSAAEPEPEGNVMKRYLVRQGLSSERILVENRSQSTVENLTMSRDLLLAAGTDPSSATVGIVTNNFHVYRAVSIASKAGFDHVCGIAAPSRPFYLPNNMLRECLGIVKDFLYRNL